MTVRCLSKTLFRFYRDLRAHMEKWRPNIILILHTTLRYHLSVLGLPILYFRHGRFLETTLLPSWHQA